MNSFSKKFTIVGNGFIGSHLYREVLKTGYDCDLISRGNWPPKGTNLEHVVFTSGMNSGFRKNALATAEAHVSYLVDFLGSYKFTSFLYLSSTRLYLKSDSTNELSDVCINSNDPDDIFAATKLTAEMVLLSFTNPNITIARLSNVYGVNDKSENFLTSLITQANRERKITIKNAKNSEKDFIHIDDVVYYLIRLSEKKSKAFQIYNLASGINQTNAEISSIFRSEGVKVDFEKDGRVVKFKPIDAKKIIGEFGHCRVHFNDGLKKILRS